MSHLLDREVVGDHALVVDPQATTRSVMTQHLRNFGFAQVRAVSRPAEARELLELRSRIRLVVCDYHFDGERGTGQDLLDELRREQLLPPSTVFVMVTSQATYPQVAEAAEAALDSYLVKPFSAATLFERLKEARQRKRVLKDVFEAMAAREYELAVQLCMRRFQQRAQYAAFAARLGAEMMLMLGQAEAARAVYEDAQRQRPSPWARLGIARAQLAGGDTSGARRLLEAIKADQPQYAELYDVLGRLQLEQGQLTEALDTYRTGAALTPGCILRQQHCGTLAFLQGDRALALEVLERAVQLGLRSRLFDALSLTMLAFMRHDQQDERALDLLVHHQRRFVQEHPHSLRLRRLADTTDALQELSAGKQELAWQRAARLAAECDEADFDFEAALNLLGLRARLARVGRDPTDASLLELARRLADRFSVSRASTETLCAAVEGHADAAAAIREAHAAVNQHAESAMNRAMAGDPATAVHGLLQLGGRRGNCKFIELAAQLTRRHHERIEGAEALLAKAEALVHRFGRATPHLAGFRRSQRSTGGLALRRAGTARTPKTARPAPTPRAVAENG